MHGPRRHHRIALVQTHVEWGADARVFTQRKERRLGVGIDHRHHGVVHGATAFSKSHCPGVLPHTRHMGIEDVVGVNAGPCPARPNLGAHKAYGIFQTKIEGRNEGGSGFLHGDGDGVMVDASVTIHHGPNPFKLSHFACIEHPNAVRPWLFGLHAVAVVPHFREELITGPLARPLSGRGVAAQGVRFPKFEFHHIGGCAKAQRGVATCDGLRPAPIFEFKHHVGRTPQRVDDLPRHKS